MNDWARGPAGPPDDDAEPRPLYAPGQELAGRYRLIRKLAAGGMGEVWVGHHLRLDVQVAIKVVRTGLGGSAAAERLLVEARAAAKLDHPAIVRVFDVGNTENGMPFIVMELLDGEPLAARVDREDGIQPIEVVKLLLPIARGLGAAHDKGLIHRDVKPDNVFLARLDAGHMQPKILDFGIVKLKENHKKLTRDGIVLGSVDYVSPEQARGLPIDHRADVWSFCVSLYEAIAGFRPFVGDTYRDQLHAIVKLPHTPLLDHGLTDGELSRIVDRGLEKDPVQRYGSMQELGEALTAWLVRQGVSEDSTGAALRASYSDREDAPPAIPIATIERTHTPPTPMRPEREGPAPAPERVLPPGIEYVPSAPPASFAPAALSPEPKRTSAVWVILSVVLIAALAGGVTFLIVRSRANELAGSTGETAPAAATATAKVTNAQPAPQTATTPQPAVTQPAAPPPVVEPVAPATALPAAAPVTEQAQPRRNGRPGAARVAEPTVEPPPPPAVSAAAPAPPPPPPPAPPPKKDEIKDPYSQ